MKIKRFHLSQAVPQIVIDIVVVFFSYFLAMELRFEGNIPWHEYEYFAFLVPYMTIVSIAAFFVLRFYNTMWQFASMDELLQIFFGTTIAGILSAILGFLVGGHFRVNGLLIHRLPISVYVIGWALMLLFVGGSRFSVRLWHRRKRKNELHRENEDFQRVMVIGAGEMGSMIIKDMKSAPESQGIPVIAIDDNRAKRGTRIHGVKVVGGRESIPRMAARYDIDQILLAISNADKKDKQDILSICAKTGCRLKTLPALYELMQSDDKQTNPIRDIDILDLLGRDEVHLNVEEISGYLKGKTILVTGGGGSIGSELCRQIAYFHPKKIIIFDIYENNAYDLQNELLMQFKNLNLEVLIGSVRDRLRVEHVMDVCRPDVVFHAAAHKHVPLMELSPGEAVKNNVFGTWNVAQACDKYHVKRMVLISTDKAVNPTNIMGATKRICELIIQYSSRHSKNTEYVAVRFGNVLGSNGSVIPLFKRQIAAGGPVTVTHPDIIRYFMTIPEAARLVIQAGGMAKGGEIFVLDMGQPVKIVDLARNMIWLSGFEPDVDIKITYTGLRPGEKLYEELLLDSEGGCQKTSHKLIYIGTPIPFNEESFLQDLDELRSVAGIDNVKMIGIVHRLVPTYSGHAEETDALAPNNNEA